MVWGAFSVIYHFHVRDSGCFYSSILSMFQICKEGSFLLTKKKKKCKGSFCDFILHCNVSTCHDSGNTEMPDAMETIFQAALAFGRRGGVSILSLSLFCLEKKKSIYLSFPCI